jgi:hypothetical protein
VAKPGERFGSQSLLEETAMAIVVVAEFEGGDQEFYEEVSGKALPGGQLAEGAQVHISGPIEGGWRVITVWDSEEQFERFRDEKLTPILRETGWADRVTPQIQPNPVFRLITA